jgi:two-component system copper resistance phosphate regulon response regulator CusR
MRVQVADLVIDLQSHTVTRGDTNITLTGKEFALLELLARNVRRVVSRADIVAHVWDDNHDPFTNAVEVYMNRLRGKIDRDSDTPVLHTRRGVGYILTDDPPG